MGPAATVIRGVLLGPDEAKGIDFLALRRQEAARELTWVAPISIGFDTDLGKEGCAVVVGVESREVSLRHSWGIFRLDSDEEATLIDSHAEMHTRASFPTDAAICETLRKWGLPTRCGRLRTFIVFWHWAGG